MEWAPWAPWAKWAKWIGVVALALLVEGLALLVVTSQGAEAQSQPSDGGRLWADDIIYEGSKKLFNAKGRVRIRIDSEKASVVLLTEHLRYDERQGLLRLQGGDFGKETEREKQGALRLPSGEIIFFQRLETDATLAPLAGEGIGLRRNDSRGSSSMSAVSFRRRVRKKHEHDDWIFHKLRYTRCPVCADAQAKRERKARNGTPETQQEIQQEEIQQEEIRETLQGATREAGSRTGNKRALRRFPPLWRIDASRMRWERFEKKQQGWFNATPRIHLRNARLNLYGVPVLYTPYLSFPAKGARASGLLAPEYGNQSERGWYVAPPIYWAPHRSLDATYVPIFTSGDRDASRFEIRTRLAKKNEESGAAAHLFDAQAGWSLPHKPIDRERKAQFFAYGKARWRAPWGLRADAVYHAWGDPRYLYNYGQGADLFSTSAPSALTNRAQIEHFSRNGYTRLALEEERELLSTPRADARLLPDLSYEHNGGFATSRKGGGSWKVEGRWRGAGQEEQQAIAQTFGADITKQTAFRQDLVSAAATLGWRQNLPWSFVSQSTLKLATSYWHDTEEGDLLEVSPEFQQSLEGLFAKGFRQKHGKSQRVFYLRPVAEIYATLDEGRTARQTAKLRENLGGKASFYETGARLGERLAFDSALEGGQRMLLAAEIGVKTERGSAVTFFAAPHLRRQGGDKLSGRLWTGVRASFRDQLSFAYDTTLSLPHTKLLSQQASVATNYKIHKFSLAYKEFHAFDARSLYQQDIILKSSLRLKQRWNSEISAGYGFLGQNVPIGFSLTYKGSCVTLKFSYDRNIYSDREDTQSFGASLRFDFS